MLPPIRCFAVLSACLFILSSPGLAAEFNQQGAEALKAVVQTYLDDQKRVAALNDGEMIFDGPLTVEPASGYYAVTLPHLKLRSAAGRTTDMGIISINAVPGDTDRQYKMAVALASPIKFFDAEGKPDGEMVLGAQKASGVWDLDLNSYSKLDARYADVVFTEPASKITVTIPETTATYNLTKGAGNLWSGPVAFGSRDIKIVDGLENTTITLDDLTVNMTITDHNPVVVRNFNDQMAAIAEAGKNSPDALPTSKHALGMYNLVTDLLAKSSDGFTIDTTATGFSLKFKEKETQEDRTLSLAKFSGGFGASGFTKNLVDARIKLAYEGLQMIPLDPDESDVLPHTAKFDIGLNKVPFQDLVGLGKTTIKSTEGGPKSADLASREALLKLPDILSKAGTNITLNDNVLQSPAYHAFLKGVITANIKAVKSATADISGEVKGLDALAQKMGEVAKDPNNPAAAKIQESLGMVTMLQMMGQQKPDDPSVRVYKFVLDEQGRMMLNGADLSALGGLQPPAASQ